jgi:KaiC/GvpD/RAD55 family RecA-like ATPase
VDLEAFARDGIPPLDFLVDGWLVAGDVALVAGPAGSGKSTTVYALGLAIARGESWCGVSVTRPGCVLVIDEEQGVTESARLLLRLGAPHENVRLLAGAGVRLSSAEGCNLLRDAIEDCRPAVVILDSATQIFAVANENDAAEVGERFAFLFELRDRYGCTFILIHHKSKDAPGGPKRDAIDRPRGSTVYTTQAATVWLISRVSREAVDITQAKRRGAQLLLPIRVSYSEDEAGKIRLAGEVMDEDSIIEKVADCVIEFLASRDDAKTSEIEAGVPKQPGASKSTHSRGVGRALKYLVQLGHVVKPKRGVYRVAESKGDDE